MSSLLAQQLLARQNADIKIGGSNHAASKYRSSVMFDAKEAADYDLETIHELGMQGLLELIEIHPNGSFSRFRKTLFSTSFKNFNRSLKSASENEKLNYELRLFFKALTPFFLTEAAPKVLEYLIRAFRIEELNVDDVLITFLPFHSSDLFKKLISLIRVEKHERWTFLSQAKKNKTTPDRAFIVSRSLSDKSIIDLFLANVIESVKANRESDYKHCFSFTACLFLDYISSMKTFTDDRVRNILSWCFDVLKVKDNSEFQLASILGLVHLCSSTLLDCTVVEAIMNELTQHVDSENHYQLVCAISMILQTQKGVLSAFPDKAFQFLVKTSNLIDHLVAYSQKGNIATFMNYLLPKLSSSIMKHQSYGKLLAEILETETFSSCLKTHHVVDMIRCMVENHKPELDFESLSSLKGILTQRHPEMLDQALQSLLASGEAFHSSKAFEFFTIDLKSLKYSLVSAKCGTLPLAMQSADSSFRLLALKKMDELFSEKSETFDASEFSELLKMRLVDSSLDVCSYAWSLSWLSSLVEYDELVELARLVLAGNHSHQKVIVRRVIAMLLKDQTKQDVLVKGLSCIISVFGKGNKMISETALASILELAKANSSLSSILGKSFKKSASYDESELLKCFEGSSKFHMELYHCLLQSKNSCSNRVAAICIVNVLKKLKDFESQQSVLLMALEFLESQPFHSMVAGDDFPSSDASLPEICGFLLKQIIVLIKRDVAVMNWFSKETESGRALKRIFKISCGANDSFGLVKSLIKLQLQRDIIPFLCSIICLPISGKEERTIAFLLLKSILLAMKQLQKKDNIQLLIPVFALNIISELELIRKLSLDCIVLCLDIYEKDSSSLSDTFYGTDEQKGPFLSESVFKSFCCRLIANGNNFIADPAHGLRESLKGINKSNQKEIFNFLQHHLGKLDVENCLVDVTAGFNSIVKINFFCRAIETELDNECDLERLKKLMSVFTLDTAYLLNDSGLPYFGILMRIISHQQNEVKRLFFEAIPKDLVEALRIKKQSLLFASLVTSSTLDAEIVIEIKAFCRHVVFPSVIYQNELVKLNAAISAVSGPTSSRKKMKSEESIQDSIDKIIFVLEVIRSRPEIQSRHVFVSILFDLLESLLNAELDSKTYPIEFMKQMVLSLLQEVLEDDDSRKLDSESIRIELLVHGLRTSSNPQIHNHIFVLFSIMANFYPVKVLNNIMPVLTFLGANTVRQDDSFTAIVIRKTIESVIPTMIKFYQEESSSERDLLLKLKGIFRVFVDNLNHIPKFRQFDIFSSIGAFQNYEFFYILLGEFCEKVVTAFLAKDDAHVQYLQDLLISLCQEIPSDALVSNLNNLIKDTMKIPVDAKVENALDVETIYNIAANPFFKRMQYRVSTIETISQILSCFSELGLERLDRSVLVSFVESCLCLATQSSMQTFKGSNVMVALSYDCLKQISKALSFDSLCFVVQDLLGNETYIIKEKAVAFLSDRLALNQKVDGINVMEICDKALNMVKISPMTETGFIQSVWVMSNIAFKRFAIDFADQILPLIPIIMGPGGMLHAEDSVVSASLKCMASLCSELGPRILPHINVFMKILLELFKSIVEKEKKGSDLHSSSLELVKAVFEAVPLFLTPFLKECIKFLLFSQTSDSVEIIKTASEILELSSIAIEPRILMPIIIDSFPASINASNVKQFFEFLGQVISKMDRKKIGTFHNQICKLFFHCMDFPAIFDVEPCMAESSLLAAFKEYVLKLNENLFKPMFLKFVHWTEVDDEKVNMELRCRMFYGCVDYLLDHLKSLLSPYFISVMENWLAMISTFDESDAFERDETDDGFTTRMDLWKLLIGVSRKTLLYDNDDDMFDEEKFLLLGKTLVGQMGVRESDDSSYLGRMKETLIPAIVQLAVAANVDTIWKPLNQRVLQHMKDDDPAVRIAAIHCTKEFYTRMGEEFLVLLPETIPSLAELMEDDDEDVEKAGNDLIKTIEHYLGEPLQKYFK